MSNGGGWEPKKKYATSGISSKGQSPSHLTATDYTAGMKQIVGLEEKRVKDELEKERLNMEMVLAGLDIGNAALSATHKRNQAWLLSKQAQTLEGMKYDGKNVFIPATDTMTAKGYAKQTMTFTPEMTSLLSVDDGEMLTFLKSAKGKAVMDQIKSDPSRFTRLPGFTKKGWDEVLDMDDPAIDLQKIIKNPESLKGDIARGRLLDNPWTAKNEAEWAEKLGATPEQLEELNIGCFGKVGGKGCGGN